MNGKRTLVIAIALLTMLVTSGWAATLEVSQPVQVTSDSYYERGQAIVYDGSDYWLFYGRSASCTVPYSGGNPDLSDYVLYYKKAGTVAGLASATATQVLVGATPVTDSYMGETSVAYMGGNVWVFATIYDGVSNTDLYGYYTGDGGSTWTQVGPYVADMSSGQGHHDEIVFGGELWILEGSGDFHTMHSSTPTNAGSFGTPLEVQSGLTGGLGHFFDDGTELYLALGSGGTYYIHKYNSSTVAWDLVDSKTISGYYDPTLFKVGSDYVFYCAPYTGGRQWIVGWTGTTLDGTFFDGTELDIVEGRYGANVWVDMWPIGYTTGSTSYVFYTSERDEPAAEGVGNIWYLEIDWTVSNDHYTYIQEAIDAAVPGDAIDVSAGTYAEYLHITTDDLTVEGAGIDQSVIDLDGLMPYWHYDGCSTSYASRAGVLLSGYGSPDEIVEDVIFRGFTVKNAGLNPPSGGAYTEYVDPEGDGQDDVRGIGVHNGKNVLIENCKVQYSGYNGFGAGKARCTTLQQSEDITIKDCVALDNCSTGIVVGDHVGFLTITGNVCTNNKMPWTWYDESREYAGKGIEVVGGSGAKVITGLISGNTCTANGYQGITLKNYSDGVVVEDNVVTGHNLDEDGAGIFFYASSSTPANCVNDTIRGNTLSGNIRGIVGYYAQDALIEDNTISTASGVFDPGQEGIKLDGCNGCLVAGNTLTDCDGTGIKTQNTWNDVECYSNTVTGNTVTNANGPGIRASSGSHDNTFDGNTIDGADFAGIFIYLGAYDNTFTDNLVTGVTTETFYAGEDYEVTQGDGIFLWGYNGDFDARAGTGNTFSGNGVYGNAGDEIENQVDSMIVDASGNWWGSTVAATVAADVGSYVDYTPWAGGGSATSPGFACDYSTLYADNDSPQSGTATRLQEGHDLASGSTLHVADGTYGADPVTGRAIYITKDGFSLIGQSETGTVIDGAIGGVGSSGSFWPKGIHVEAENVTVSDLTIKDFTGDLMSTGGYGVLHRDYAHDEIGEGYIFYDGCTVEDVAVTGCYSSIYALCFTNLTVADCTVTNSLADGMFIARGSDYADIHDNVVTNSGDHGIWVGYSWTATTPSDNAIISGNVVDGAREGGISFVASDGAVIEGNEITNVAAEGWSVGALSLKDGPSNVVAQYNQIHHNDGSWGGYSGTGHGVGIDGTPANISLHWNSIYGNTGYGCYNYSTVNVDATNNWWGDASGPNAAKGSGDRVSDYVLYDPWIGATGGENIVCVADPTYLDAGTPTKTVDVNYLGGGGGLLFGYNVTFTWDSAIVTTSDVKVTQGTLLSSVASTFWNVSQDGDEITVDCILLGADGVTGPGTMFTIEFTGDLFGTSPIDITVARVRDRDNNTLSGFYEDDGELIVDVSNPTVEAVLITNDEPDVSNTYVKNGDQVTVTANVEDDDPAFGLADIVADLSGLGGGAAVNPDTYADPVATWNIASASCTPGDDEHVVTVTVDATDAMGNTATQGSDDIIADNLAPTAVTGFDAAPANAECDLAWTNGTDTYYEGTVVRRTDVAAEYPQYPWFVANWAGGVDSAYPTDEADGTGVYDGTGTGVTDGTMSGRNIYYYQAFCYDGARNYGPVATGARDLATNYWLGDVSSGWGVWGFDGLVDANDILKLSDSYGLSFPTGNEAECDVGPTVHPDWHRLGLPLPDDAVEFEDAMIFAMNYGVVTAKVVPFLPEEYSTDVLALTLNEREMVGSELSIALRLEGNSDEVKGMSAAIAYDTSELEFVSARLSDDMSSPLADVFFWSGTEEGRVLVDALVLGTGVTIGGSGDVAVLTFRSVGDGYALEVESARIRNADNVELDAKLGDLESGGDTPLVFRLVQNAPNPFNPVTKIAYHVPNESEVTIRVYDVSGRVVRTLVDGMVEAGRHAAVWDGTNDRGESVGSGIYFCTMVAPEFHDSRKMTLLK